MNSRAGVALAISAGVIVLSALSAFTVDQRQRAIVFQLGEIKDLIDEPGLYFKIPLIQNVRYFDKRILTLDTPDTERFITSEKKNVLVDSFVKWRIQDMRQYYISVNGDEQRAQTRLSQTVNAALREEFGKRTVHDVVSGERDDIMRIVRDKVEDDVAKIGVQIVDVRLKRIELPQEVSEAVYRRMDAERKSVAADSRSQGFSLAEKIRAEADRVSFPRSPWECRLGRSAARATRTTRSVADGIPTRSVGTRRKRRRIAAHRAVTARVG